MSNAKLFDNQPYLTIVQDPRGETDVLLMLAYQLSNLLFLETQTRQFNYFTAI